MWTSLTSACPKAGSGEAQTTVSAKSEINRQRRVAILRREPEAGFQGRTGREFRTKFRTKFRPWALGRESRRPSRRAISTSFGRDSITAWHTGSLLFLSNLGDNPESAGYSGRWVLIRISSGTGAQCYLVTIISFHG